MEDTIVRRKAKLMEQLTAKMTIAQIEDVMRSLDMEPDTNNGEGVPTINAYDGKVSHIADEPYSNMKIRSTMWHHLKVYQRGRITQQCTVQRVQWLYSRLIESKKASYFSDQTIVQDETGQWVRSKQPPRFAIRKFHESILDPTMLNCVRFVGDTNSGKSQCLAFNAWCSFFIEGRAPIIGTYAVNAADARQDIKDAVTELNAQIRQRLVADGCCDDEIGLYTLQPNVVVRNNAWEWSANGPLERAQVLLVTVHKCHLSKLTMEDSDSMGSEIQKIRHVYGEDPVMTGRAPIKFIVDEADAIARSYTSDPDARLPVTERHLKPIEEEVAYIDGISATQMGNLVNGYEDRKSVVFLCDRDSKYVHFQGIGEYRLVIHDLDEPFRDTYLSQRYWEELLGVGKPYASTHSYDHLKVWSKRNGHKGVPVGAYGFKLQLKNTGTVVIRPPGLQRQPPAMRRAIKKIRHDFNQLKQSQAWKDTGYIRAEFDSVQRMLVDMIEGIKFVPNPIFAFGFVASDRLARIAQQEELINATVKDPVINLALKENNVTMLAGAYHSVQKVHTEIRLRANPPIPKAKVLQTLGVESGHTTLRPCTENDVPGPLFSVQDYMCHLKDCQIIFNDDGDATEFCFSPRTPISTILTLPYLLLQTGVKLALLLVTRTFGGRATNYRNVMPTSFSKELDLAVLNHPCLQRALYITHQLLSFDCTGHGNKGNEASRGQLVRAGGLVQNLQFGPVHTYGPKASNAQLFGAKASDYAILKAHEGKLYTNKEWAKYAKHRENKRHNGKRVSVSFGPNRTKRWKTANPEVSEAQTLRDRLDTGPEPDSGVAQPVTVDNEPSERAPRTLVTPWTEPDCENATITIDDTLPEQCTALGIPDKFNILHITKERFDRMEIHTSFRPRYHATVPRTVQSVMWLRNNATEATIRWLNPVKLFRSLVVRNDQLDETQWGKQRSIARALFRISQETPTFGRSCVVKYVAKQHGWTKINNSDDNNMPGSWQGRHLFDLFTEQESSSHKSFRLKHHILDGCGDISISTFQILLQFPSSQFPRLIPEWPHFH